MNNDDKKQARLFDNLPAYEEIMRVIQELKTDLAHIVSVIDTNTTACREIERELRDCQKMLEKTIDEQINPSLFEPDSIFETLDNLIGTENAAKVINLFEGQGVYINKSWNRRKTYEAIKTDYRNGSNYRTLSLRYGYTETHIRNIIHK